MLWEQLVWSVAEPPAQVNTVFVGSLLPLLPPPPLCRAAPWPMFRTPVMETTIESPESAETDPIPPTLTPPAAPVYRNVIDRIEGFEPVGWWHMLQLLLRLSTPPPPPQPFCHGRARAWQRL